MASFWPWLVGFLCDPTQILEFTIEMVSVLLDIGLAKKFGFFHVTENPSKLFGQPNIYTVIIYVSYYTNNLGANIGENFHFSSQTEKY